MVAKRDFFAQRHPEVDVPNLHVIKACTVSFRIISTQTWCSIPLIPGNQDVFLF